ncbi:MAG TPA: DEAD/DEAH box helicase, partial [Tianweitania sediminis]|nr:DEAD/DEAH box helicase [Tianweitania sediminis]
HSDPPKRVPPAAIAARLVETFAEDDTRGLIHIAGGEHEAEETARAFQSFQPGVEVLVVPPWDCLPYDRTPPQRSCMGQRMEALAVIARAPQKRRLVVTSPAALLQGLPPAPVVLEARFRLAIGEQLDREALTAFFERTGYVLDDRVDEAGEAALLGDVIDIFPAAATGPVRIVLDADGRIEDIRTYDPATQRTHDSVAAVDLGVASEVVAPADGIELNSPASSTTEARMSLLYGDMDRLLERLSALRVSMVPQVEARAEFILDLIEDARSARREFGGETTHAGEHFYLDKADWNAALKRRKPRVLDLDGIDASPRFFLEGQPRKALSRFVEGQAEVGMRVLVSGAEKEGARLAKVVKSALSRDLAPTSDWQAIAEAEEGSILAAPFDLDRGFTDKKRKLAVIAAADMFGERLFDGEQLPADALLSEPELRVGDVVIHEDHGLGVLRALETVVVDGAELDAVRLEYHNGASVLAPVGEFGRIWRYGGEAEAVKLDRLENDAWLKRRAEISAEIDAAAADLIKAAKLRAKETVEPIVPPRKEYARSAARFPYPETPDQAAAIEAVLADFASGKVMNRLVCGDVGFGKTEIALRAAAAVAFSGRQVAIVAPTTVLARQHFETFQRRFAGTDIGVGHLSRITAGSEMEATKAGLKSGEVRIVVGTQALASKDVAFSDLALLVVDEEHRFGAKLKETLRALAPRLHTLTMSATPIPRTLQSAMVGVQDVSVLASPPARRRPVRTFLMPFDPAAMKTALVREKRRGGQSFVVTPRIEDLDDLQDTLKSMVPDLEVRVAHGKMDAKAMDEVMVGFASGEGDILL